MVRNSSISVPTKVTCTENHPGESRGKWWSRTFHGQLGQGYPHCKRGAKRSCRQKRVPQNLQEPTSCSDGGRAKRWWPSLQQKSSLLHPAASGQTKAPGSFCSARVQHLVYIYFFLLALFFCVSNIMKIKKYMYQAKFKIKLKIIFLNSLQNLIIRIVFLNIYYKHLSCFFFSFSSHKQNIYKMIWN